MIFQNNQFKRLHKIYLYEKIFKYFNFVYFTRRKWNNELRFS